MSPVLGKAGEDISEPSRWPDVVELGRKDQRGHNRGAVGATSGAGEEP